MAKNDHNFPIQAIRDFVDKTTKIFTKNDSSKFESIFFKGGHSFPKKVRKQAYD